MTLQEALTILTTHQQWRRGADIEMAEPKVITEALDIVLAYHHVGTNEMIEINKTMKAVEWLAEQLEEKGKVSEHTKSRILEFKIDVSDYLDLKRQAKEMEKQQIIDAFDEGQEYEYQVFVNSAPRFFSDTYYNQTYGSKGSDENFKQFSLYEHKETITSSDTKVSETFLDHVPDVRNMVSSQTEISDEDIEEEIHKRYMNPIQDYAWRDACKWYREQLKTKA